VAFKRAIVDGRAEENGNEVCLGEPNPAITLTESNRAYVTSFHDGFGQESQNRVIERLEQPLQIRKSIDQASSYGFTLYAPGDETIRATIVLVVTEDGTKQAQVRFTRALDEFESSFTGSRCFSYDQGSATESGCDIPYVWQDNTWYSLILDQTGDQWAASIKNLDTGIEDTIGTFTGDAVHRWQSLQIGLSHRSTFTPEACDAGVPSIRAHFGRAIVNSDIFSEPLNPSRVPGNQQIGACALASGDWNFSPRSELEDPLFAFELGQLE